MISRQQLAEVAKSSGLSLFQQEKDYLLKLFLFNYYNKFDDAVFKGGTCLKYLHGLNRFSEDLDFNIKNPKKFQKEVKSVLKQIELIGISFKVKREELFEKAFTVEIVFQGPLFVGKKTSMNSFRIDAGLRLSLMLEPEWNLIQSEYPETPKNFFIKSMNEKEMLAEKVLALFERRKGRDLFDLWFLLKKGAKFDSNLFDKKLSKLGKKVEINLNKAVSKKEYERDLSKLSKKIIPYNQIIKDLNESSLIQKFVGKNRYL